jgi:formylglycine-generating enzyme required for sulfatase activity
MRFNTVLSRRKADLVGLWGVIMATCYLTLLSFPAVAADNNITHEKPLNESTETGLSAQLPVMIRIPNRQYEIGKFVITQVEWRAVMGNNPSNFSQCGDGCPVENVSWDDAQLFIQKLNDKTGKSYRLPSESEWELACYGGLSTKYCGSNDLNSVAWFSDNSHGSTQPVGQKQANGYGIYDMSGNVWEWMSDCYNGNCETRVLRGGSWGFGPNFLRAAFRSVGVPSNRNNNFGFRLARTLP